MITSEKEYLQCVNALETITQKGTDLGDMELLSSRDKDEYIRLSSQIRAWEKERYPFPIAPNPLLAELQIKMTEQNLKQKDAAQMLGIDESCMSEIMRGKRHISMPLAKKMWKKFSISAEMIMTFA